MNTKCIKITITTLLGCAAIGTLGCTQTDRTAEAAAKSVQTGTQTTMPRAESAPAARQSMDLAVAVAGVQWTDVKDASFALRDQLLQDLTKLQAKVDGQVTELTSRRATLAPTVNTDAWDFAMKEMDSSRTGLQSSIEGLNKATRETWDQEKDKVGIAWTRTQDAYAKVIASTTSGTTAGNN